jgi:tRNA(Ile)-lysidine synthase
MLGQVRREGLLSEGRPVVVLYSGGRDSTCLLDLAVRVTGAAAVRVLHVNYGLRDEADRDERHCRLACEQFGVELTVERPRRPPTGNLQAWAREARYAASATLAGAGTDVATGHTATDQVETILYRLASSPSRRALLGMNAREGAVVRPLLSFTRAQTAEYCRERGLEWREDATNDSDAYARGRIRNALLPALEAVHPAAAQNVLAVADVLRAESELLDALVAAELGNSERIALARLRELAPALRRLVVQRLADAAAGGLAPGAARRADEIAKLNNGNALDIGSGVRAVVEQGTVRFEKLAR